MKKNNEAVHIGPVESLNSNPRFVLSVLQQKIPTPDPEMILFGSLEVEQQYFRAIVDVRSLLDWW